MKTIFNKQIKKLYDKYFIELCSYASSIICDDIVAQDIVQDLFIKLWEENKIKTIASQKSYLYKATKNNCISWMRSQGCSPRYIDIHINSAIGAKDTICLEYNELYEAYVRCLEKLPTRSKEVFEKSRIELQKQTEIAKSMDVKLSTVKTQLSRALKYLRSCVKSSEVI